MGNLTIALPPFIDKQEKAEALKAMQIIQNLNKLQKQGTGSGQFVIIGLNSLGIGTDEVNFFKQCRPMFPVYKYSILEENEVFCIYDSEGRALQSFKDPKLLLQALKRYGSVVANIKRMKSLPVQHPLGDLNLSIKEYQILCLFEPGKPWKVSYEKLEKEIDKTTNRSKVEFLTKIKKALDKYMTTTVPEVCRSAKTKPVANYYKLVLLGKSLKGMDEEDMVNKVLTPLQADKNIAELAKQIDLINKYKETTDKSKVNKKKIESFIASLNHQLQNSTTATVKVEIIEYLEELMNILPEADVNPDVRKEIQATKIAAEKEMQNRGNNAESEEAIDDSSLLISNNSRNKAGDRMIKRIRGVEFVFRYCPPGTFMMGSPEDEEYRDEKDEILHKVTLTKGFWILETEVTQKQWKAIQGQYYGVAKNAGKAADNYPVINLSWKRCQEFCKNCKKLGLPVQLPTEAQWEYACRAGSVSSYAEGLEDGQAGDIVYEGEDADKELATLFKRELNNLNIWPEDLNVDMPGRIKCDELYGMAFEDFYYPVGKTTPNKWGIYDMHVNASEWCLDLYVPYHIYNGTTINPAIVQPDDELIPKDVEVYTDRHVIRGGRSANRFHGSTADFETGELKGVGFRIVLVP